MTSRKIKPLGKSSEDASRIPVFHDLGDSDTSNSSHRFGEELFRLRKIAGLTQSGVARLSDLARGYYSQLENSKRFPPPPPTVDRIISALCLSVTQSKRLRELANAERCAMVVLPEEIPADSAGVLRRLAVNAYRLSSQQLRAIENVLDEELAM